MKRNELILKLRLDFNNHIRDNYLKDKCEGYVIITNEENLSSEKYELVYNAYIKCGKKYITANYSEY